MALITILVGIMIAMSFIVMVLFVLFGQITVRKLRKNSETKNELGFEFASGWDILNVAQALALPMVITRRLKKNSPLGFYADVDTIRSFTNRFDYVLAIVFYWLFVFTGLFGIMIVMLNAVGVFD